MNKYSILILAICLGEIFTETREPTTCNDEGAVARKEKASACKGLPIDQSTHAGDKYCCLFKTNSNYWCGSVSEEQYTHIKDYVRDKKLNSTYEGFKIKCGSSYTKVFLGVLITLLCLLF